MSNSNIMQQVQARQMMEAQLKSMSSIDLVEVINQLRPEGAAELAHADFLKKVRKEVDDGIFNEGNISFVENLDKKGETRPMYQLDKIACLYLVSGENGRVRMAIIKRWQALEAQQARYQQEVMAALQRNSEATLLRITKIEDDLNDKQQEIKEFEAEHKRVERYWTKWIVEIERLLKEVEHDRYVSHYVERKLKRMMGALAKQRERSERMQYPIIQTPEGKWIRDYSYKSDWEAPLDVPFGDSPSYQ